MSALNGLLFTGRQLEVELETLAIGYSLIDAQNAPTIWDDISWDRLVDDVTSAAVIGGLGLDGRARMFQQVDMKWQEVPPGLRPWAGTTKQLDAILQRMTLNVSLFSRMVEQSIDDRQSRFSEWKAEEIAVARASGPWQRHENTWEILLAGDTGQFGLAFDGQFMFDTDHEGPGGSSQSNIETGGFNLNEGNLSTVLAKMIQYRRIDSTNYGNRITGGSDTTTNPEDNRNQRNTGGAKYHIFVGADQIQAVKALAHVSLENPTTHGGTFTWSVVDSISKGATPNAWFVWFPTASNRPLIYVTWPTWEHNSVDGDKKLFQFYNHDQWGLAYSKWYRMHMAKP